jgi:hypothetical protein
MDALSLLCAKHPLLFATEHPQWSDLPWGWFPLVDSLCTDIERQLPEDMRASFRVTQIKEKFGGLRFHYQGWACAEVEALVDEAENASESICAYCGLPGSLHGTGYRFTWCESCGYGKQMAVSTAASAGEWSGTTDTESFIRHVRRLMDADMTRGAQVASHCYRVLTSDHMPHEAIRTMVIFQTRLPVLQCHFCRDESCCQFGEFTMETLDEEKFLTLLYSRNVTALARASTEMGNLLTEANSWAAFHDAVINEPVAGGARPPLPWISPGG